MEDLRKRVKDLMREIEFAHLKKDWRLRIIEAGIDESDANKWVAELGHIVDEYERSLRFLIDLLREHSEAGKIASNLDGWLAYTRDMTLWKLEDVTNELDGKYEKYLPPESDDDE